MLGVDAVDGVEDTLEEAGVAVELALELSVTRPGSVAEATPVETCPGSAVEEFVSPPGLSAVSGLAVAGPAEVCVLATGAPPGVGDAELPDVPAELDPTLGVVGVVQPPAAALASGHGVEQVGSPGGQTIESEAGPSQPLTTLRTIRQVEIRGVTSRRNAAGSALDQRAP